MSERLAVPSPKIFAAMGAQYGAEKLFVGVFMVAVGVLCLLYFGSKTRQFVRDEYGVFNEQTRNLATGTGVVPKYVSVGILIGWVDFLLGIVVIVVGATG